ncbi:MAG: Flp pilus assembly protein CpaB [Candidatus Binataceae bacterium]
MRRPIIFVLLAGVAALVAALVVYSALKKREAEVQQAKAQTVQIVVAAHDLTIGTKLDPDSVKLVRWSRDSFPPGAYTDPAAVMNQYTRTSFVENEPVVADRLFSGDKNAGVLPLLIPAGMRALSVPVDEVSDIAGFVLPHAHIDVLVALSGQGTPGGQAFSKIVLQDVEVLAVAQEIEKINDKPQVVKVVTLLVTPEQAERLALASREGSLRLAMRNYDDKKIVMTNGVDVQQMLHSYGGPAMPLPVMPVQHTATVHVHARPQPVQVEVMRNGHTTESISFIRAGGSMGRAPTVPPAASDRTSSAAQRRDKVASASDSHPVAADLGGVAAPAESNKHGLAAVNSAAPALSSPGTAGFNAPRSKTIDIP